VHCDDGFGLRRLMGQTARTVATSSSFEQQQNCVLGIRNLTKAPLGYESDPFLKTMSFPLSVFDTTAEGCKDPSYKRLRHIYPIVIAYSPGCLRSPGKILATEKGRMFYVAL
jgi:hypothetical protein